VTDISCYCGSGENFSRCCQPLLLGKQRARTPKELMRSRYSAYCQGNVHYLISTHHPSKREVDERDRLVSTISETTWLGLKVLNADESRGTEKFGYVEFVAFFQADSIGQLHEKSRFISENGFWYYLDGVTLPPIAISRNEPCWCQSGKKYKKCHGK